MPTLLEKIMADSANVPVIEAFRHAQSWKSATDNSAHTNVLSHPQESSKKRDSYKKLLKANTVGILMFDVNNSPDGKLTVVMRLPFRHEEVDEAIRYAKRQTQPARVVPPGTDHIPTRRKGEPRQKQLAAGVS